MTNKLHMQRDEAGAGSRRLPRRLLAGLALCAAVWCLLTGLLLVVPAPGELLSFAGVALTEFSLVVTATAGLGIGVAALAGYAGSRRIGRIAAVVSVGALVVSLVPLVNGLRTATDQNVTVSLWRYLPRAGAGRPSHPVTYVTADRASSRRQLDVWRPTGRSRPAPGASPGQGNPAVVLVHGGGWNAGSRGGGHLPGWLARRGYVVFDIDYRLATSTSPSWQHATGDVKCAVGWVRTHAARYGVDPERIGLLGSSAGGHLALLAAYASKESRLPASCPVGDTSVQAVAALYPVTDLTAFYRRETGWWNRSPDVPALLEDFVGGTPATFPDRYTIASPLTHADPGAPPTYLAHGTRDQLVPISQSVRLTQRLRHLGVPHRLVRLHGSGHGYDLFGGGWNAQTTLATLDDFLQRWLEPTPR